MTSANNRIHKIVMKRFRGATGESEIDFDPHQPVVVIYGENGSGKSSIVDALDFVCNQTGGSISDRSSTKLNLHLPAIGNKAKDVNVEVFSGNNMWSAGFDLSKIKVKGSEEPPPVYVLRRSRMASLIEATPSERYQQLQSFIDVEGVERSEQSLRDALRIAEKAVDYNSTTRLEAEAMLERFWNDEGQPGAPVETPISWASKQSSVNLHEIDSSQNRIREILVKLDKLLSTAENYLQSESNAVDKQTELARVSNSIEQQPDTPQIQAVEAIELLDILRQARKYLTSSRGGQNLENNSCPVCEQSVDTPDLINRIDERLTVNSTFTKLGDSLQAAKKGVENANAVIERDRNDMISTARDLYPLIKDNGDIAGSIVSAFKFDNWNEDKTSELNKLIDLLRTYRASLLRERDGNLKIVNQLNSIQQFYKRVVDLSADLSESKMQADRLKQALDMVHYLRMDFTQQILSKVKTETNRLYFAIHPDEPLGLDDLRMDMDKRASLIQGCNFEGYDNVVPQAYYSDAHLDTLGFCLWLAITRLSSNGDAIIVLDDIFTTLDEKHFDRVMDVLVNEVDNFSQIILTTHHRHELNGDANIIELQSWNIENGIRMKN